MKKEGSKVKVGREEGREGGQKEERKEEVRNVER